MERWVEGGLEVSTPFVMRSHASLYVQCPVPFLVIFCILFVMMLWTYAVVSKSHVCHADTNLYAGGSHRAREGQGRT